MALVLATHAGGDNAGWYIGIGIGFAIIVVVVILVATILALAARIGGQAREAISGLDDARQTTLPLWELRATNKSAEGILEAAKSARRGFGGWTG
jgi:hypothetical protein